MKRLIYILLVFSFTFTGCIDDVDPDNVYGEDYFVLNISNALLTKATDPGLEYERMLNTLDCFFYPKGQTGEPCVFYHRADLAGNTSGQVVVPIFVVEDAIRRIFPTSGECEIFIIANLPDALRPTAGFSANNDENTRLDVLNSLILQMNTANQLYDDENKPFVMAGQATGIMGSNKNASATVSLYRASSKITLSVYIPESLDFTYKDDLNQVVTVNMLPVFNDAEGNVTLKTAFHNGAYKGYIYRDGEELIETIQTEVVIPGVETEEGTTESETVTVTTQSKCLYTSEKKNFTFVKEQQGEGSQAKKKYVYKCEIPFYTYARAWEKGAADAAYMTFEMPWCQDNDNDGKVDVSKGDKIDTYYYQILINGGERTFLPNHWYDMKVNVGVIGSKVESVPTVIDHQVLYVLDWTDQHSGYEHPDEDVQLEMYTYLNLDTKYLELDNVGFGAIYYDASHRIGWKVARAYDINNSGVNAVERDYAAITKDRFTKPEGRDGVLYYNYEIPQNQYSPIYIDLEIWLDFNGNGTYNGQTDSEDEREYKETIRIVQYPAMYVVRDTSSLRSVYVNGVQHYTTGTNDLGNYQMKDGNTTYSLGSAGGVRNHDSVNLDTNGDGRSDITTNNHRVSYPMYTITVSSFASNDKFTAPPLVNGYLNVTNDNDNNESTEYNYIIGDPRQRSNVMTQTNSPYYALRDSWATDKNGNKLQYYYPTDGDGNTFQVIAPKFRIVSFNNASTGNCDEVGAALRCASLQEDGIPAGRWRLPTVAEVKYIIMLQKQGAIQPIFTSSSSNYATAAYGNSNHSNLVTLALENNNNNANYRWNKLDARISVRCVYDEWFWGSNRDAVKNNNPSKRHTTNANEYYKDYLGNDIYYDRYYFTWGDREITW